ncbi:hypothetical protein [Antrihabitans stalactiti]|uniref:Uncharacterized protein n=1 Tax=Antrihabitans stalactiti TaxID=2584121 RepID=A0A848KFL6_9NOCA|nr:hypothetical protein [Antrihabitans stalactiti]NMN95924.1 hypothetical protein [Antrihabitans stalactiti]
MLKKSAVFALAGIAASAAISVVSAPRAAADANGCTWSKGGVLAHNCINVRGSGTYVESVASQFYFGQPASIATDNVCDRQHEIAYTPQGGQRMVQSVNLTGCLAAAVVYTGGDYAVVNYGRNFEANSTVCTRAKNSATTDWTEWACETIEG